MTTLIMTAKLNDVDPQAWLADVLGQIADIPQGRLAELLPWNWKQPNLQAGRLIGMICNRRGTRRGLTLCKPPGLQVKPHDARARPRAYWCQNR